MGYTCNFFKSEYYVVSDTRCYKLVKVSIRISDSIFTSNVYRGFMLLINDCPTPNGLVELIILDFDVIMGLYWFVDFYANIKLHANIVRLYF